MSVQALPVRRTTAATGTFPEGTRVTCRTLNGMRCLASYPPGTNGPGCFHADSGSAVKAGGDCWLGDMFMTQHPRVAAA